MSQDLREAFEAAKQHARETYPEESCGLIVDGAYVPVPNIAADPSTHVTEGDCTCRLCAFAMHPSTMVTYPNATHVLHSHPDGQYWPSAADMRGQMASGLAWGVIALDIDRISDPVLWGNVPIPPIIGRTFLSGVTDCFSLMRDTFRLGKDKLAEQGIDWPLDPVEIADQPRDDAWWEMGQNLYLDHFSERGFRQVKFEEARPADVFLCMIRSDRYNHGGLLLRNNLILHHLPGRLSRREPAGIWARHAGVWLRYEGKSE